MPEDDQTKQTSTVDPAGKRGGAAPLVPFTLMIDPNDLATVRAIARASQRTASDVMREMLSYGQAHMLERAFAPADGQGAPSATAADVGKAGPKPSRRRRVVGAAMDPDALAVLDAMAGDGRGARPDALRRAIAEGLAVAEGGADD